MSDETLRVERAMPEPTWPSFALPRGTEINGYRLDRILGSGGQNSVVELHGVVETMMMTMTLTTAGPLGHRAMAARFGSSSSPSSAVSASWWCCRSAS